MHPLFRSLVPLLIAAATAQAAPLAEHHASAPELMARPDLRLQQQNGSLAPAPDPVGTRQVIRARAGAKQAGKVGKAALILPFDPLGPGARIRVTAELFLPLGNPANSIHLFDLECKFCGPSGNPGLRLYLRHGRLRVDRKKIGGGHAWTDDSAPALTTGRWHLVTWELNLGTDAAPGRSQVYLDGQKVLDNRGRTLPDVPAKRAAIDRLQIGITANSNPETVILYLGAVTLERWP
ncbi:hypothetical protein KBY23_15460 [Ruegeria pomeroyi]|nr:hypothetical protein [Ruegeria pomeroyi]